jgi:hypothetical protein
VAGPSSANFVQRGNPKPQNKSKKPPQNSPKAKQAHGAVKKKKKAPGACFVCESTEHLIGKCLDHKMPKSATHGS